MTGIPRHLHVDTSCFLDVNAIGDTVVALCTTGSSNLQLNVTSILRRRLRVSSEGRSTPNFWWRGRRYLCPPKFQKYFIQYKFLQCFQGCRDPF